MTKSESLFFLWKLMSQSPDIMSTTHRVRDTVKALTREQEKLLGQLKEVQTDKEESEVRAPSWFAFSVVHPLFYCKLTSVNSGV